MVYFTVIPLIILGFFLASTDNVSGQVRQTQPKLTEYELLAPIPLTPSGVPTEKTTAAQFIPGLFRLTLMIATGLAVLVLIYGGVQYMSTDAFTGKESAKDTIWNAIMGLLLALSAWLIIATINPKLLEFNFEIPVQQIRTTGTSLTTPTGGTGGTGGGGGLSQQAAQTQLSAGGVVLNGPVNLVGIQQRTVNELINLKRQCGTNCEVRITSATGGTHASGACSHGNGYKADLRLNPTLNDFITRTYSQQPNRSDGARMYRAPSGALYAQESNHWDVAVPCN